MQFAVQLAICCHMLVQFAICYCIPYSLLFVAACNTYIVATCRTVSICCCMPRSLLFVAARCTICYLLLLAIQLSYSLIFIAACRTACYLLLHAAQLAILFSAYCTVSHLLQQAVQFAAFFYSLLSIAASRTASHILLCAV